MTRAACCSAGASPPAASSPWTWTRRSSANITATLTDDEGNTSRFALFGPPPTNGNGPKPGDSDGDGISDTLEDLAGSNPTNPSDAPQIGGSLVTDKVQIALNFATQNKDSLSAKIRLILPTGYTNTGATWAIQVGGLIRQVSVDGKGSGPKGVTLLKVSGLKSGTAAEGTVGTVTFTVKSSSLQADLASVGLTNKTTLQDAEVEIPVAIAIGTGGTRYVFTGEATVLYKAKLGKSGKAKLK